MNSKNKISSRIFKYLCIFSVSVLVLSLAITLMISYYFLRDELDGDFDRVFLRLIFLFAAITLGIIILIFTFATVISSHLAHKIAKPLNNLRLEPSDNIDIPYEELSPFAVKIQRQSTLIRNQLNRLQIQNRELAAITDNMSEGLIIIDNRADILSYNASAISLLNADPTAKYKSILSLNRTDTFRRTVSKALIGKRKESVIQSENRYNRIIATPVIENSTTVGAVILIFDETEKIKGERVRREFTSNVSHELKTPLTSISGFAELMKSGTVSHADCVHFSENVYNEAQRLITLVNDIIKLSKLDEGALTDAIEEVDIAALTEEICSRLSLVASNKNISIYTSCENAGVQGNKKIIEEMIFNLCDNALKYNKEGGYVKISVKTDGKKTSVCVEDNGIGIPKEAQSRIFERFFRVDKSHSKEIGGTGLGLSIVKHGAIYHSAEINLESEYGKGTAITVIFNNKFIPKE